MENKKLNGNELKDVTGGRAVLPLLSDEKIMTDTDNFVGATKITLCPKCGAGMPYTSGKDVCPNCGAIN